MRLIPLITAALLLLQPGHSLAQSPPAQSASPAASAGGGAWIEFGSPNALYRRGWRQTDLPPRNTITVTGYPSLDQSLRISATDVKLPDGRTLFAGSPVGGGQ